jgi:putative ABC transport system permease protein
MKLENLIIIAWKALQRNRLRAFLTMLGIIIGVASVISMLAIGQGSKKSIQEQISAMGSNMIIVRPGGGMMGGVKMESSSMQNLENEDVEALRQQTQYISDISPVVSTRGQVIYSSNNHPTSIEGVNTEYLNIRKLNVESGQMFTQQDIDKLSKVCLLGKTVVENLFPDGQDPVGQTIRFQKIPFKVVGVLSEKGENTFGMDQDDIIIAPYTTVQKRVLAITHFQNIFLSAINEESAEKAADEVTEIMRSSHQIGENEDDDFHVRTQSELINTFSSTTELLTILLAAIAGISLLVGGIGIMNIMYVSVTERTKEIGLRMSIGARNIDILLQFLVEAILISLTGGLIGVILGIGAAYAVSVFLSWPTTITEYSVFLSFLVCAITGVFFGWYPARKAANLDPIEALRYE